MKSASAVTIPIALWFALVFALLAAADVEASPGGEALTSTPGGEALTSTPGGEGLTSTPARTEEDALKSGPLYGTPLTAKFLSDSAIGFLASSQIHADPVLVAALIHVESTGRPRAVSHVGARGLMQVRPDTADWINAKLGLGVYAGPESLFDAQVNVEIGSAYIAYLINRYGYEDGVRDPTTAGPRGRCETLIAA